MRLSSWIRQGHRVLSIVFTIAVIANFVRMFTDPEASPNWVTYSPLPPLFLLLFSGLYMFALPYFNKQRQA
jgi:hypothetical protein